MIDRPLLTVSRDTTVHVAALRYFDSAGSFGDVLYAAIGQSLPAPLTAARYSAGSADELILAWRSPTETLMLCSDARRLTQFETLSASRSDGCIVNQSGGLCVWRVSGAQSAALLTRIGSTDSIPALGEARTSRIAEQPVMSLCVETGQIMLLAERVYVAHVEGWIASAAADL